MTRFRYGAATLTALAIALAGALAGCGGADMDSGESAAGIPQPATSAVDAPAASLAGKVPNENARQARSLDSVGGSDAKAAQDSDAAGGAAGDTAAETKTIQIAPEDRAIIYTADLTVRVKDVSAAIARARQIVEGVQGLIADEKSSFTSDPEPDPAISGDDPVVPPSPTGTGGSMAVLTFKVPPARYAEVLTQLGRSLGDLQSQHQGTQDVTEEVADVGSRVKSAESSLDQLRTLLSKTDTVGEILSVEREIANREAELESLQARQKSLAGQTAMATITLSLVSRAAPQPAPEVRTDGFLGGLKAGWDALVNSLNVALAVLGALIPWIIPGVALWLVFLAVRRRVRRDDAARRAEPAPAVEQPQPAAQPAAGSESEEEEAARQA